MDNRIPGSFFTSFISDGWEKIGSLKETIQQLGLDFTGDDVKAVQDILQDFIDAQLICIGRLEKYLVEEKSDFIDKTPVESAEEAKIDSKSNENVDINKAVVGTETLENGLKEEPTTCVKICSTSDTNIVEPFEFEADFDNVIGGVDEADEISDTDIEELRKLFSV